MLSIGEGEYPAIPEVRGNLWMQLVIHTQPQQALLPALYIVCPTKLVLNVPAYLFTYGWGNGRSDPANIVARGSAYLCSGCADKDSRENGDEDEFFHAANIVSLAFLLFALQNNAGRCLLFIVSSRKKVSAG